MGEINLEFVDRTEEFNEAKNILKFMKDCASLIHDSSVHYFEPLYDVDILNSSQISFTFKYDYNLIENE